MDSSVTRPSDWNAIHVEGVATISSNTGLNGSHDIALVTAGAGGVTITLPTAVGATGRRYLIKKIDSAAGSVDITTTSSQTIDGLSGYSLTSQYQKVKVMSDGANWQII